MNRCYCPEYCLKAGEINSDGRPLGVTFAKKHLLQSHQLRLERERQAREAEAAHADRQAQARELHVAGARIFATTLLDDPPVHNETTHSTEFRSHPVTSDHEPIEAIIDGVRQISLLPESSTTGIEGELHRLSLETPISNPGSSQLPSRIETATSSQLPAPSSCIEAQSQLTKIALTQLSNIQSGIQSSASALVGLPSNAEIGEVKQLIKTWHQALSSINRKAPLVKARKTEIVQRLRNLEARILEVDTISPDDAVSYDTSKSLVSMSGTIGLINCRRSLICEPN